MNDDTRQSQLAENHRFFGDMRFKQLTLFMAAMTAAGAGVVQFAANRWWIALAALFVTAVMWVIEVRAVLNGIAAREAIPELFPRQHKLFWPWINSSWAVLSLHIVCYALWLAGIRAWHPVPVPICTDFLFLTGVVIGGMLSLFSIVNYWRHRMFWVQSTLRKSD